ncbi:hypothetical protein SAMN05216548_11928 [Faunimonas pinastri]|uniref:Uncharacterized protein n=1 Tax=Faunimonas pinastri TaxID=1855383 RepID=A0A1H9PBK0_9HYPH|nr:hypothetical protein [Faunimonas pinastri]SER45285.1 hypothetical protein SAMN05216548_11928 [Faunimonas pinastri]
MTYIQKLEEATATLADAAAFDYPDDYPLLAAEADAKGQTVLEIAQLAEDTTATWRKVNAVLEKVRYSAKLVSAAWRQLAG